MATHSPRMRYYHGADLRKGRRSEIGRIYLVTTVTRNRRPLFGQWECAVACARALHHAPADGGARHLAWVIMPDHVHWLLALEHGSLAEVMGRFKSRSARAVNAARDGAGPVWQRGYHDHAVRHETDVRALARYVLANPVRAGLCERVWDYPFWDAAWL